MLTLFLIVAMVHIVVLMGPGPGFLFVSQTAVSRSRKEAMMNVPGTACDVMVWAGIALLGLHLVIEKMAWPRTLTMVGGDLYPCWMGYQMLCGALRKEVVPTSALQVELAKGGRSSLKGLLTDFANPKAIIYFGSVFLLFVGGNVDTTARWGILALIIAETLAWFTVVANLFALPQMRCGYQRLAKWTDGFAEVLSVGFGIHSIIPR